VLFWKNYFFTGVRKLAEVVIIGSGTGTPSLRRGSPCLAVLSENATVVIDTGPGALRKMLGAGITYQDPDILLYTHIHPDHVSDLVPFLFACKYAEPTRHKDLLCAGGLGFFPYFEKLKGIYGTWIDPRSFQLTVTEMDSSPVLRRDLKIFSKPMAHLPGSLGYRIELTDGQSVAVSGDTDYCTSLVDLASAADLLILECSFPDEKKVEGHLTPSLAGRIASESGCKRVVLTHLYPACDDVDVTDQCSRTFRGEIIVAEDLLRIKV
jgi:ribonuclease BN (tRNA processing enzyme)